MAPSRIAFRDLQVAASLKLDVGNVGRRSAPKFRDLQVAASLKPIRPRALSVAAWSFRDLQVAASLKPAFRKQVDSSNRHSATSKSRPH